MSKKKEIRTLHEKAKKKVRERKPRNPLRNSSVKMGSNTPSSNFAPRFVRKPALRQEDDGNRLIFECELTGNPQPGVYWYR